MLACQDLVPDPSGYSDRREPNDGRFSMMVATHGGQQGLGSY